MGMKNTYVEMTLENDEIVKLTITFAKLNILKSVNHELYQRYSRLIMQGNSEDILDMATMVYVAYWCANFGKEGMLKEDEFIELVPFDMVELQRVNNALMRPKKK